VLRILGLVVALLLVAGGVAGCVAYNRISASLPDPTKPLNGTDRSTRILDRNGKLITTLYADQNRQYVTLAQIPKVLQEAVIATEDQRFYEHAGVDPVGMLRALWVDILAGADVQGGSTITQQYAKQAFVGTERTLQRKIQEALLAYRLEQYYSKDKILEMYLNTIYFGHGAYGVQTAAQTYFGTSVRNLTVAQAAMIAGVIKSPGLYSPYIDPTAAKNRRDTVLGQMHAQGYIDDAMYATAVANPIKTAGLKTPSVIAPYFVDYLKQDLVNRFGEQAVYRGGLTVTTTLDLTMQKAAEKAVASNLNRAGDPSAALVAIDPATGEIRAMVGGRDYATQQFNVATQGHRQPGSSFKPFVLVTALQDGISPEATFNAQSTTLRIPGGQTWQVAGEAGYRGPMRLRIAMMHSINPVFAQLILKVGADRVVRTADTMGITTKITPVPAVALGGMAEGVTPLEMASAYGTLADNGVHATPIDVLKVTDKDGNVVYTATPVVKQVIDPAIAYLTTDILKGVITGGTGTAANIGRPAAGKTGTTQKNSDAWFVGYTPALVASVWVGYAGSTKPMTSVHGIAVYGGSFPAHIWATFMKAALKGTPATQFTRPPGLVSARICLDSGLLATPLTSKTGPALFLAGHLPGPCTMHASAAGPKMPHLVGMTKADALAALSSLAIRYSVVENAVTGVAAGTVAAQTPAAGSTVASGTVVTVTVSTGGPGAYSPPVAAFSWTATGLTVKLDASASTANGTIVSWQWQYDAGGAKETATGKTWSHTYTTAGVHHQVTLYVTDDKGVKASITKQVTVH
jgi:penicillin-binding protein 1A